MDEQILKDFVATAEKYNYDWNAVFNLFPELKSYDQQLLKDYTATAKKYNYDWSKANSYFPEFGFGQQQPAVQPTVQPTVKKKDDMESSLWFGDGSSESEPSKTEPETGLFGRLAQKAFSTKQPVKEEQQVERPETTEEASATWKRAVKKEPESLPEYMQGYIPKKGEGVIAPTKLDFVGRMTPELVKEQTPKFLEEGLSALTPKQLASYGATGTKETFDYYFKDAGFKFEVDGINVKAISPSGEVYTYNAAYPYPSNEYLDQFKNFIRESAFKNPQIADKAYLYEQENRKFKTKTEIDKEIKSINSQAEQFNSETKNAFKLKKDIEDIEADLKRWRDFGEQNTPKYIQTEAYLNERKKEFEQYGGTIKEKSVGLEAQKTQLNKAVGKYTEFQATQGDFGGGLYRSITNTISGNFSQFLRIAVGKTIDVTPMSYLLGEESYQSQRDIRLKEKGYKDEKVVPISVLNEIDNEIREEFKKAAISGKVGDEKLNNILTVQGVRQAISETLNVPITTTDEYIRERQEKGSFIERGLYGFAGSLPAMVGGPAMRYINMYLMNTDAAMQEMDNNPNFANISENEKQLVALPIGVVSAALEEIGLKNLKLGKSITSNIIKTVIGRVPAGASASVIRNTTFDVVAEMGIKGTSAFVGGLLSEAETGILQQASEYAIKDIYESKWFKNRDMFDNPAFLSGQYLYDLYDAGRTEMVGAGVMSVPYSIAAAYKKDGFRALDDATFKIFEDLAKDNESRKFFVISLKNKINLGEVTPNQGKQMLEAYDQASGMVGRVPDEITDTESRKVAMDLISERKKLETKKDKTDPALAKPIQDKINNINEQLSKLTEDAIQKQAAGEVSVQPEAGAGQEVEVGGPEAKPKITPEESKRKENLIAALEATDKDIITIGDEMLDRKEAQAELEAITQKEQAAVTEQGGMEQAEGLGTQLETVAKEEIPAEGLDAEEKARKQYLEQGLKEMEQSGTDGYDGPEGYLDKIVAQEELDYLNKVEQLRLKEAAAKNKEKSVPTEGLGTQLEIVAKEEQTPAEVTPTEQFTEQDRARKAELEEAMRKADKRRKNITVGETTMTKAEAKAELDALVQKEQATQQPAAVEVAPAEVTAEEVVERTPEQEADLLEELLTGKKKEPVVAETITEVKEESPALANVEATTKALEKVDKDKTEGLSNIIGETLNKRKAKINTETNSAITNKGKQIKFRISRSTDTEIDQDFLTITAIDNNGNKVGYAKFLDNGNKNLEGSEVEVPSKYQKQGIASAIYSYADALGYNVKESVLQTPEGRALWKSLKTKQGDLKSISEAYHKAKADGSNPELVQAVEEALSKQGATAKEEGVITEKPKTKKSNKTNTAETKKADKEKPAISNVVPTSEKTSSTAASLGGVAYELPGGIAIIQVFNLFGQPIYIGYKNGTYTRIDIDSFDNKNNVFTEKELNDLKNLKKEIENQENKNQSDSKNPFTEQGRVAATDSVPNNIKQFVENLTKALGINKKIFIITDNDFNEGQYKKHGLFGTLAAIRSAILGAKNPFEFGSKRYMSDADAYYIYYDGKLKGSELFSVVSHEIGHIIEQELFKNASKETVEAIKNDYNNWVAKLTGKTLTEVQNETRDITIQHLLQGNVSMFDPSVHKYISSFSEYLADNVAKWARTSQKPKTLVDKFFSNLVNEFKKIRDYVFKTGNYSENIFKWLDELYDVKAEKEITTPKSLADAVRKNLKIKGPDGLQSNILGILPAIWNAGVETMAKAIEAGVAINEAVQKAIEYIREKHGKKFNEAAAEKKLLIGHYKGAIEIAREAKVTNEGLKTYLKRQGLTDAQIEPLLKIKERAEKKPISKEKAIEKPKRKKVTVDEMAALKDQIRLEARAAREAKGDLNAKRKMLAAAINDLAKKGKISVRQAKAIVNRISSVNLDNPVMVDRLLDYAENIFNDADYDTRIQEVRKLQEKVKKVNHVSMRDTVREFASINPERIPADKLLDYIQALDDMSTRTPFYQKMNDMFDEVMSYKSESKEFDAIKTFQALIDKLESIAINQVKSVEDYVALIRDINSFKRKAYQLLQNGDITQEQYDQAIENVGKDQAAVEKKYEKELAALKEKLVQEINGLKPEVHPDFTPEEAALINKYLELSDADLASLSPEDLYILNDLLNNIKEDVQLDYYRLSEIVSKAYTNAGGQKLAKQLNESKFNKSSDEGKKLLLEQESAFWEGLLGLGRAASGALQKFIVSPFNRAIASYENAMKDGYYEFSKLKRKYKMKDYNMHRLGMFATYLQEYMAQFDSANKNVKDIGTRDWFGEIISNDEMRNGYKSAKPSAKRLVGLGDTELKTIEKIYNSLPKDANGKVDPKAVYDSFMANDGKFFTKKEKAFFDKIMDWKQKNLTTKQKAANEMNGMPFKEIPFHMMRVRLDQGTKQISPKAEGGSGVVRIEAGTGKERASQTVGPIMTNFEQLFSENLEQTARNYYLQEAINDINNTLSVAKKELKGKKVGLFNTIPSIISDALNFEFDKTESQFLAKNLLAARAAETLFNVIRTSVELTSTFLSYPFRAKTPQGYKELFGKQGQMKKLLDFTSSPLRLRENINKAIDISDGRIKPKGKFEKAINYLSGLPERTMMVTSWMPTFNNEFKDITGVRFDMDKFNSDAAYRQKYGKAIKEAAAVADAQTEKIIGSTTKAGGRREIRIAPKILANIFGAEGTIKKNTTAGQILGFFSNYPYREVTEFLNGFREAAEVYKQGGGVIKSISQLQKPLGVTINLATYGFLSSVVYAMKLMLLGDDEDEEKGEGMLKELMTLKGFMEELQGNAISLGASKYAAGGKAMLQLGATVAYNSTSDEEWKAKIKKLLKNSVFVEPIDAAKVQGYGGRNEVLGAIASYVPQFVLFAKRFEESVQTAGELKVIYDKFQEGGLSALSEDDGTKILAIDAILKSVQFGANLTGTSLPMYNDIKMYMKGVKKEAGVGDIKLSGTENKHKKALQNYKNEKEFKENDPEGYLEAIDEGGSIYKYKEEQRKKQEEKNKDKPFRGMSEEAFKKKYPEEWLENYGPGTDYYEEQRTDEAIERRAIQRKLKKEEKRIKAKNKENEEDTEE